MTIVRNSIKGSWARKANGAKYRDNHDHIFRKKKSLGSPCQPPVYPPSGEWRPGFMIADNTGKVTSVDLTAKEEWIGTSGDKLAELIDKKAKS
jgi:hypothetical protein